MLRQALRAYRVKQREATVRKRQELAEKLAAYKSNLEVIKAVFDADVASAAAAQKALEQFGTSIKADTDGLHADGQTVCALHDEIAQRLTVEVAESQVEKAEWAELGREPDETGEQLSRSPSPLDDVPAELASLWACLMGASAAYEAALHEKAKPLLIFERLQRGAAAVAGWLAPAQQALEPAGTAVASQAEAIARLSEARRLAEETRVMAVSHARLQVLAELLAGDAEFEPKAKATMEPIAAVAALATAAPQRLQFHEQELQRVAQEDASRLACATASFEMAATLAMGQEMLDHPLPSVDTSSEHEALLVQAVAQLEPLSASSAALASVDAAAAAQARQLVNDFNALNARAGAWFPSGRPAEVPAAVVGVDASAASEPPADDATAPSADSDVADTPPQKCTIA